MARAIKLRGRVPLTVILGLAALAACAVVACNDTPLIEVPDCHPDQCTCEQDPSQTACKAFNDRPESGAVRPSDASEDADAGDAPPSDGPDGPDGPDGAG